MRLFCAAALCVSCALAAFTAMCDENQAATLPALSAGEKKLMDSIGAKLDARQNIVLDKAVIDRRTKKISFPAKTNIRYGTIEVLVSTPKGRCHESLFVTELDPFKLQLALILAGYDNGPMIEGTGLKRGAKFDILVTTPDKKTVKVDSWLANAKLQKEKSDDGYIFVGSNFQGAECVASIEGNLVNINSGDSNTIINAVLSPENVYDEYVAIGERIYGYVKPPVGEVPPEVPDAEVTLTFAPRTADTHAEQKNAPVNVPRSPDFIEKRIAEVAFTEREILWDYDKLMPALNQPLAQGDRKASLKIIDAKLKLMEKFLAIYGKTHELNEYLLKVKDIYAKTKKLRGIYDDSGK